MALWSGGLGTHASSSDARWKMIVGTLLPDIIDFLNVAIKEVTCTIAQYGEVKDPLILVNI